MNMHWRVLGSFGIVIAILLTAYVSFGVPVACGSHGCIRNTDLVAQMAYTAAFARATNAQEPTEREALTTLMRRYLVTHAALSSSVSKEDASRYREDILHINDATLIQKIGFSSAELYDELVLVPFLSQEALMKQRGITDPSLLYTQL